MATVPTADVLGLGQKIKTTPDKTPDPTSLPGDLIAAGRKQRAASLSGLADAALNVSTALTEAHVAVRSRADTIDRARSTKKLNDDLFTEYTKFKTQGDAADPLALKDFNEKIDGMVRSAIEDHALTGSADSQARLATSFEATKSAASVTASEFADVQQLAILNEQMGDKMDPLIKAVRADPTKLGENILKAEDVLDEYSPALTPEQEIDKTDAIRQQLVMGAVESFTDVGAYDEAKKLIDENPTFLAQLNSAQQKKILTDINSGLRQRRIARDKITAQVDSMEFSLGRKLTPDEKEDIILGKIKAPLSEAGKLAHDRRDISEEFGADSDEIKEFDRLQAALKPPSASKLGKLFAEQKRMDDAGIPRSDPKQIATQLEIDGEDPGYKLRQEKIKALPKAKGQLKSLEIQTQVLRSTIADAISTMLGREMSEEDLTLDSLNNLLGNISGQEFATTATGGVGKILTFAPFSTDAARMDAMLTTIKGINIVNTISEMRQNSPTGGAMGALSDKEGAYLAAAKGPLDIRDPESMLKTFISMYIGSGEALDSRKALFQEDYGELITNPSRPSEKPQPVASRTPDGTPIYEVTLEGKTISSPGNAAEDDGRKPADKDLSAIPIGEMNLGQIARALNVPDMSAEDLIALSQRFNILQGGSVDVGN